MKRKPTVPDPRDDAAKTLDSEPTNEQTAMDEQDPEEGSNLDEPSDLESYELVDIDEKHWEVFVLDEDDSDPAPEYGEFWMPD